MDFLLRIDRRLPTHMTGDVARCASLSLSLSLSVLPPRYAYYSQVDTGNGPTAAADWDDEDQDESVARRANRGQGRGDHGADSDPEEAFGRLGEDEDDANGFEMVAQAAAANEADDDKNIESFTIDMDAEERIHTEKTN